MVPSPGRIVHYRLSESDVAEIKARRSSDGVRANSVAVNDVFPMLIVRVNAETAAQDSSVQGHVFLDGPDTHWVTSRAQGPGEGQWSEPGRVY